MTQKLKTSVKNLAFYCKSFGKILIRPNSYYFFLLMFLFTNSLFAQITLYGKITASDGVTKDEFGYSVCASSDHLVVGAPYADTDGAVYIYEKDSGGSWIQKQKILSPYSHMYSNDFGNAVSISGDYLAIGAVGNNEKGVLAGAVYVYKKDSDGIWGNEQMITASDGGVIEQFGYSLDLSGDVLVVGGDNGSLPGDDAGSVYVYSKDANGVWGNEQKLSGFARSNRDFFGLSVSTSGNQLVIGTPANDSSGENSGCIYMYTMDENGLWGNPEMILPSDGNSGDYFGHSVSLSGKNLIVSAPGYDDDDATIGAVYAYEKSVNGVWINEQIITPYDKAEDVPYGASVSVSGDQFAVSSLGASYNGLRTGGVYVYEKDGNGNWGNRQGFFPYDGLHGDWFGYSVSLFHGRLLIGAVSDDDNGEDSGSVFTTLLDVPTNVSNINVSNHKLHQNTPNPFSGKTVINFQLDKPGPALVRISDLNGKTIQVIKGEYPSGVNSIEVKGLNVSGLLYYTLEYEGVTETKKMLVLD